MDKKELEESLRRAFCVDKLLPAVGVKRLNASIGRIIVLPDGRPLTEIIAERRAYERPTNEDLQLWETVMFDWLPLLDTQERDVIRLRCMGMGWKHLSYELQISVRTAQRRFESGLGRILQFLEKNTLMSKTV